MCPSSGASFNLGLLPYGQHWRQRRRAFWQNFHPNAVKEYHSAQLASAHEFLKKMLDNPSRLQDHLKQ